MAQFKQLTLIQHFYLFLLPQALVNNLDGSTDRFSTASGC